jgi:hypothetical protein
MGWLGWYVIVVQQTQESRLESLFGDSMIAFISRENRFHYYLHTMPDHESILNISRKDGALQVEW